MVVAMWLEGLSQRKPVTMMPAVVYLRSRDGQSVTRRATGAYEIEDSEARVAMLNGQYDRFF